MMSLMIVIPSRVFRQNNRVEISTPRPFSFYKRYKSHKVAATWKKILIHCDYIIVRLKWNTFSQYKRLTVMVVGIYQLHVGFPFRYPNETIPFSTDLVHIFFFWKGEWNEAQISSNVCLLYILKRPFTRIMNEFTNNSWRMQSIGEKTACLVKRPEF